MDAETLAVALGMVRAMPDGASAYADEAEAAAEDAQEAAQDVVSATVAEVKTYLGIT